MHHSRLVTHLDVIALVVVAALAEQAVFDDAVHVEHVEHRIRVLERDACASVTGHRNTLQNSLLTLLKLAVKTTTS